MAGDLVVQRLAHAVEALEFEIAAIAGQFQDRRQGVGVVGRELGIERIGRGQKFSRAGNVGDIGVHLAREHRKTLEPLLLGAFDLRVPIGSLDQPNRQPPPLDPGQGGEPVDQRRRPLLVGLNRQAEPLPAGQFRVGEHRFDHVEGDLQPVRLLGIDAHADAGGLGPYRQIPDPRDQFADEPPTLGELEAGMQRRQLDRDPRTVDESPSRALAADGGDGVLVGVEVALGVTPGMGRLAQHIVGMAIAVGLVFAGAVESLVDGASHDELAAHDPHRLDHRLADHRFAASRDQPAQERSRIADPRLLHANDPAGEHQRPGRGIDEQRLAAAQVPIPPGVADLVGDQFIGRLRIGDPQKRLRQAHQHHPFLAGQVVFVHEGVEPARALRTVTNSLDEGRRPGGDSPARRDAGIGLGDQRFDAGRFVGEGRGLDRRAQGIGFEKVANKGHDSGRAPSQAWTNVSHGGA